MARGCGNYLQLELDELIFLHKEPDDEVDEMHLYISLSRLLKWVMGVACANWLPPILGREVCSLLPIELTL